LSQPVGGLINKPCKVPSQSASCHKLRTAECFTHNELSAHTSRRFLRGAVSCKVSSGTKVLLPPAPWPGNSAAVPAVPGQSVGVTAATSPSGLQTNSLGGETSGKVCKPAGVCGDGMCDNGAGVGGV
jgi:hypothetical protein